MSLKGLRCLGPSSLPSTPAFAAGTLRQQGIRIGKALVEANWTACSTLQYLLELRFTLHERLLSDIAAAPFQQIESIYACSARPPVQQCSEIWLSRGTRGFDGAITDDSHRQTGNLRIGVNCIIVRAAKAVYVLNHIDDDPSRCTAVSSTFYDDLAESYHLIFDDWDSAIRRQRDLLIRLLPGPANGKRVLDCACGIGTQAIGLAMLGFTVEGSDTSTGSIQRAQREVSLRGLKAEFRNDDMRILSTAPRNAYDAVIAMDNALPHLQCDEDIERALGAMRGRLRSGGVALVSLRDYGPLIAQRPSSAPASLYLDGKLRRIVHQVWDWQDERRYLVHLFITIQQLDGWHTRHFVGQYRAIAPGDVASLAVRAGFDDVRVLSPDDTGYYQPLIRAVAPATSSSG